MDCKPMLRALERAVEARREVLDEGTSACRLVDGAGDGLPGLVIDAYAGRLLVQTLAERFPEWVLESAVLSQARSVYWKVLRRDRKEGGVHVCGEACCEPFCVRENGLVYEIDFQAGYSQGIFLDQRAGRKRLAEGAARGRRVLNCFAYTCAFGVAAAVGGASAAVNIDLSRRYLDWGMRNYALNGVEADREDFIHGDVFDWLGRMGRKGREFDLVLLDPPSFSRSRRDGVFRVESDYARLVEAACRVLSGNGEILAYCNKHGLTPEAFGERVSEGAAGGGCRAGPARILTQPDFPGSSHLKCVRVGNESGNE